MERVTVEQVKEAYKKTEFIPVRKYWFLNDGVMECACALTAISVQKDPSYREKLKDQEDGEYCESIQNITGFSFDYVDGFTSGFDDPKQKHRHEHRNQEFKEGFEDGAAAWSAIEECEV